MAKQRTLLQNKQTKMISRLHSDIEATLEEYRRGIVSAEQLQEFGVCIVESIEKIIVHRQLIGPARGANIIRGS